MNQQVTNHSFINAFKNHLSDGLIVCRKNGEVSDVNQTVLDWLGIESDQLFGLHVHEFLKQEEGQYGILYTVNKEIHVEVTENILDDTVFFLLKKRECHNQESLLKTLMHIVPDFIGIKDGEGRFVFANDFVGELFGVPGFNFIGKSDRDLAAIIPSYRDVFQYCVETDETVWQNGEIFRCEEQVPTSDGGLRIFDVYKIPVFYEDGRRKNLLVFGREITEKIASHNLLEKSEARYRLLAENSVDMISTHAIDHSYLYVSPASRMLLGREPEEMIGTSGFEILHPDDVAQARNVHETLLAKEMRTTIQFRLRHKDGDYIWVESSCQSIIDPQTDKVKEVIGVTRDITERKRTEKLLLESTQRYKSLIDHNPNAVYSVDRDGRFVTINQKTTELIGYETEELVDVSFRDLLIPKEAERLKDHLSEVVKGQPLTFETYLIHKSGAIKNVKVTGIPIEVDSEIIGAYGVAYDITEVKKTEELLRKSDKLAIAGQLAASIAHEIRNPLTALKGFIQLFGEKSGIDARKYYDIMLQELNRIEHIMTELLLLAKPQIKSYKNTDIKQIMQFVITLLERQAGTENIHIVSDMDSELPLIYGEENELKQVFINLIKNAIEAMADGGGMIRIQGKRNGSHAQIIIEDQGCGIPKECINQLGEPFFTTKEKGTGLGLMVSCKIIKEHKGTLIIESEEGKGTTITITLPV